MMIRSINDLKRKSGRGGRSEPTTIEQKSKVNKSTNEKKITKDEIRRIIDSENGEGYSNNINLNGYVFTKNGSFLIFEFKNIEDVRICHIKYIYFKNKKDLITIMVNCCNFWMGNQVQFIFYKEKQKNVSAVRFLRSLNFRVEVISRPKWKYNFKCKKHKGVKCTCPVYSLYK